MKKTLLFLALFLTFCVFANGQNISGTTKLHRLEENLGAVNVELTDSDLRELDEITSQVKVSGERYGEGSQKLVNR